MSTEKRHQEIKKYQVWYRTEDGKVTSPFMVLSNNRMNSVSPVIVGAPVILGQADPMRWYQVPFVGACGKPYYIDICSLFSIQTSILEDRLYSATLSYYTVKDTDMHEYVEDAIGKMFDLSVKSVSYNPVSETEVQTNQNPSVVTAPASQPISLTINLNGVPYTATVSESISDVQEVSESVSKTEMLSETDISEIKNDTIVEPEMNSDPEVTTDTTSPKMCKAVDLEECKKTDNSKKTEADTPEPRRKKTDHDNSNLTFFGRNELENYIINNHKTFGGGMRREEISAAMNVSVTTVDRYVARVREYLKNIFYRGGQTTLIPAELIPRFLIDYANDKAGSYKKYSRYIHSKDQMYGCVFRYKRALKQYASKVSVR